MAVAIKKGEKIQENLEALFKQLNFVPGKKVFVKPNLSGRDPVLPGENTSVEVMDALVKVLQKRDCEIVIGHGGLLGNVDHDTPFQDTIDWAGFSKFQKMPGVEVLNLDELKRRAVQIEEMTFHLPLDYMEKGIDTYINLAKIKTHMEATVSFSLKNQMGFPSKMNRVIMHKTDLEMTIARLAKHITPDLSILEAFPAMEKNGPHHGAPIDLGLLVAGTNMVELDTFVSRLLGFDTKKIRHIQNAINLGVGSHVSEDVLNKYADFQVSGFQKAKKEHKFGPKLHAYPNYACSRCINAVNLAGKKFKKHPWKYRKLLWNAYFSKQRKNVVFGKVVDQKFNPKEGYVCVGNCTKSFADENNLELLDKCPPGVDETRDFIEKGINKK